MSTPTTARPYRTSVPVRRRHPDPCQGRDRPGPPRCAGGFTGGAAILLWPTLLLAQAPAATIDVHAGAAVQRVWPEVMGINLDYGGAAALKNPQAIAAVRHAAIRSLRFPNGCEADRYDWKADNARKMTVDQFLAFCDAIDAEPYYVLNLQGGTEGRDGTPPAGAPLDEVIKYRHRAPNPCGYTDYYFGTLAETLALVQRFTIERAAAGKRPILTYEMGNENWGQGRTDWPPEIYAATVAAYAQAMRAAVEDAKRQRPVLKDLRLHITAVGYPMVGNNQNPLEATDRDVNVRWTREVNALFDAGHIDAVTDHPYPFGHTGTDLLVWTNHNMQNIYLARRGLANPRLGGYRDEALAYRMPIEITEWNLKCWGSHRRKDFGAKNLEFEEGLADWGVETAGPGSAVRPLAQGRRQAGLRLTTAPQADARATVYQAFPWAGKKTKSVCAAVWVRTTAPDALTLQLADAGADGRPAALLGEHAARHATQKGRWQKLVVRGSVPDGATRLTVAVSLVGPHREADVDAVELYCWDDGGSPVPVAGDTAAQQLLLVDGFRVMIEQGIRRAHLHHLFGGGACGIMLPNGRTLENYKAFAFFAGRLGTHTLKTDIRCGTFDHDSLADRIATDFNAIPPDVKDVPVLSAVGMRDDRHLYLLVINRSLDATIDATIRLHGGAVAGRGSVRSLTCKDIDMPGVQVREADFAAAATFTHRFAPHAAYVFRLDRADRAAGPSACYDGR